MNSDSVETDIEPAAGQTPPPAAPEPPAGPGGDKPKSLIDRALGGMVWMYSGNAVFVILRGIVLVVLARLLTPEEYGLVGAALLFVNFIQLFSQLGVGPALIQRPELDERHLRTAFTVFTLSGLLFAGFVAVTAPLIAQFFQMDGLIPILRVAVLAFPIQGFTAVPVALMRRELRFRKLAIINVVAYGAGYGVVGIGMAYLGFGVWSLVGAVIARVSVAGIMLLFQQPYPKQLSFDREPFRDLMHFGGGFTIARLLDYVGSQGDNAMVGRELGAAALGTYGRAFQLITIPSDLFGVVLDEVLFPSMAKLQNDLERLRLAYRSGIALYAIVLLPFSVLTLVLAPEIVRVILGPQWNSVVLPFQILVLGMLFRAGN
ncbi:MAG: lipopolysaccharide biosynthesis protein, partial [Anaerolineales bacterium]|nr:lipopolysaccharide biosynthesis protein [Anaerolineales bacterium]